jgi:hypothetical protein
MCPDSGEKPSEFWKKTLESKMEVLRKEASQNDYVIGSDSVRVVTDLDQLRKIELSLEPPTRSSRWPIALVFLCTLVIVSVLFFSHVRSTRISLDATVSEITFTVDARTRFSPPLALSQARISGVILEPQNVWACPLAAAPSAFVFQASDAALQRASVSVDNFDLPQGTVMTVGNPGNSFAQDVKLTLPTDAGDLPIVFSAVGEVELRNGDCTAAHPASPFDRLTFHPSERVVDVSFQPLAEEIPVPIDIPASHISMYRVITASAPDSDYAKRVSTLFSGSLFFESIGSRERKLREGERIELDGFQGSLLMLHPEKDRLRIRLMGEVADVRSGESKSSLKPTWFDYLTANYGLSTLWAAVIYCFGVSLTLMKFWRGKL